MDSILDLLRKKAAEHGQLSVSIIGITVGLSLTDKNGAQIGEPFGLSIEEGDTLDAVVSEFERKLPSSSSDKVPPMKLTTEPSAPAKPESPEVDISAIAKRAVSNKWPKEFVSQLAEEAKTDKEMLAKLQRAASKRNRLTPDQLGDYEQFKEDL